METEPSTVSRNHQEPTADPTQTIIEAANVVPSPSLEEENTEVKDPQSHEENKKDAKTEKASAELQRLVDESRAKAEGYWNDLLRIRAEMENLRRRSERDVENAHKFALERFVMELLPVKDSLELGLVATVDAVGDVAKLREGINLTLKMFATAMTKFGVAEIYPANERFNPELHQAMTVQPSATVPPNTVLNVYQKGYTLNERLIRPALVIVSQAMPPPPPTKIEVQA